jgi:hypothetical protein
MRTCAMPCSELRAWLLLLPPPPPLLLLLLLLLAVLKGMQP